MNLNYQLIEVPTLNKTFPMCLPIETRDVAKLFRFKKSSTVILTNIVSIDGQLISMDSWVQLLTTNKTLRYIK